MYERDNCHYTYRYRSMDCINLLNSDIFASICGIEQCKPNYLKGPDKRDGYHIHFILSGNGIFNISGETHYLSAGQIFIIPKNEVVYYKADSKNPWLYCWITVNGANVLPCLKAAGFEKSWVRNCNCNPESFVQLIEEILDLYEVNLSNELKRNSIINQILALLIETKTPNIEMQHEFSSNLYIQYALQYIHKNYAHIRVSDISDYIGINRSYLSTIFKNKMNVSLQKYLLTYRLKKGLQLLSTTNMSIQDISAKVGYDNPLTFSKMFKNAFGKSPRNYRQSLFSEQNSNDV